MTLNGIRWYKYCLTATGAVFAGGVSSAHASQIHTVKPGDNLSSIARKYHVTIHDIIQANHLTNQDALGEGKKLVIPEPPKPTVARASMHKAATIQGDRISVRMGPDVSSRRVDMFDMGARVTVTASRDGWFQVTLADGREGWVRKDFIKLSGGAAPAAGASLAAHVAKPHGSAGEAHNGNHQAKLASVHSHHDQAAHAPKRLVKLSLVHSKRHAVASVSHESHEAHRRHSGRNHFASASHASHRSLRGLDSGPRVASSSDVVRTAVAYRGTPYHYGGTGRGGFDCSGFTSYIYKQKGVSLPHNAAAQYSHGSQVAKSDLKPGDLVFFHCGRRGISHVGIFVGNGKFVHASSPHSGGVRVDSLSDGYYKNTFRGARRIKK